MSTISHFQNSLGIDLKSLNKADQFDRQRISQVPRNSIDQVRSIYENAFFQNIDHFLNPEQS